MANDSPDSTSEEKEVSKWEAHLHETKTLPPEGQEQLRGMLASVDPALRDRVIQLLNPRGARVVEISDERLRVHYAVTTKDNYGKMSGEWDQSAVFDAARGLYVNIVVQILKSPKQP